MFLLIVVAAAARVVYHYLSFNDPTHAMDPVTASKPNVVGIVLLLLVVVLLVVVGVAHLGDRLGKVSIPVLLSGVAVVTTTTPVLYLIRTQTNTAIALFYWIQLQAAAIAIPIVTGIVDLSLSVPRPVANLDRVFGETIRGLNVLPTLVTNATLFGLIGGGLYLGHRLYLGRPRRFYRYLSLTAAATGWG